MDNNGWNKGLPTEFGLYACVVHDKRHPYTTIRYIFLDWQDFCVERGGWFKTDGDGKYYEVIGWKFVGDCPFIDEIRQKMCESVIKRKRSFV